MFKQCSPQMVPIIIQVSIFDLQQKVQYHSVSLPDLRLGLGVDGENEVRRHVGFLGGGDDRVLSRLQAVLLDQLPVGAVQLFFLHREVCAKEGRFQASLRGLGGQCILF